METITLPRALIVRILDRIETKNITNAVYITQASLRLGGSSGLVTSRLQAGWTLEKAFTKTARKHTKHENI